MIKILAVFITLVATSMTAVAAFDRGGTLIDKVLLVAMSVVIVLAVHLLLAISRRPIYRLVWTGCLVCAVYGHLTFLTHASLRASQALAQQSALTVGTQKQIEAVREAVAQIKARPVAEAAAKLATTDDKRVRAALRAEIAEGKKAGALRDELVRLSQVSTSAQVDGAVDPVNAKLAEFFGVAVGTIAVTVGLIFSILLELIGALVWVDVLRPTNAKSEAVTPVTSHVTTGVTQVITPETTGETDNETTPVTAPVIHAVTTHKADRVTSIKNAIQLGKCKGTVAGIREYLGCSQATAQATAKELRCEQAFYT